MWFLVIIGLLIVVFAICILLSKEKADKADLGGKVATLIISSSRMLNLQLSLCDASEKDMKHDFVRGYLFGFFDSTFSYNLGQRPLEPLMYLAFKANLINGIPDGQAYLQESVVRQSSKDFASGQVAGGGDHHALMEGSIKAPTGLAAYFMRAKKAAPFA